MELVERAYDINIFDAHLAAYQGRLPGFDLAAQAAPDFLGKAILFATDDLVFKGSWSSYERGARDLPHDGEHIDRGKPVCTVFSRGRTRPECYNGLRKAAAEVQGSTRHDAKPVEQRS
jgi:predicted ATP-grasp superfamily ATP-dependent carboligase